MLVFVLTLVVSFHHFRYLGVKFVDSPRHVAIIIAISHVAYLLIQSFKTAIGFGFFLCVRFNLICKLHTRVIKSIRNLDVMRCQFAENF